MSLAIDVKKFDINSIESLENKAVDSVFELTEVFSTIMPSMPWPPEDSEEGKLEKLQELCEGLDTGEISIEELEAMVAFMVHLNGFAKGLAEILKPTE